MTSFATAVPLDVPAHAPLHRDIDPQNIDEDVSKTDDESAVGNYIDIPLPPIGVPKNDAASIIAATGANVDARRLSTLGKDPSFPFPAHLSERTRRPSAIRADSAVDTIASSIKDLNSVPTTRTQTINSTAGILNHVAQLQFSESPTTASQITKKQNRQSVLHFAALCWCFVLEGWNDGTVGPLLPVIQDYYSVSYPIPISISFLLITSFIDWLCCRVIVVCLQLLCEQNHCIPILSFDSCHVTVFRDS